MNRNIHLWITKHHKFTLITTLFLCNDTFAIASLQLWQLLPFLRLQKITPEEIQHLKDLEGTPLEYVLSREAPKVTTSFSEVYMGSALSYQVSIYLLRKQSLYCDHPGVLYISK